MVESKIRPEDFIILVADDEESIRSMLGEAITGWGFQVTTVPNAEAALEYFAAGHVPHLLLTDIRMGGMTGIELAGEVKKISSEIEVIIMTSHGSFETAVQAMRLGVHDYLSKPFENIDDVRRLLIHVCERIYLRFYSEYLVKELQRKNGEIETLAKMSTELARTLDLAKVIQVGCQGLSEAFGNSPTLFFQYVPSQKSLVASSRSPAQFLGGMQTAYLIPAEHLASPPQLNEYFKRIASDEGFRKVLRQAWESDPKLGAFHGERVHCAALLTRDVPRGVFVSFSAEWDDNESPPLLARYMQTVSTAFENSLLHTRVVEISIRDGLTGLYNVRFFRERFAQEISSAQRLSHPISLMFFDVDHFKKYNDTHGHPGGDEVLRIMSALLKKSFRGSDIICRYGGEEFVVLMPHTAFADALTKAESFRKLVEDHPFPNEQTQPLGKVTISIGVSEYPTLGADVETVVKAADDALYEGKKKSRNVVVPGIAAKGYIPPYKPIVVKRAPPA